jgi:hypothetical protein
LQQLIEAKMKGVTIEPRAVSTPSPVIDLMAALKRSLAQEPSTPEQRTSKRNLRAFDVERLQLLVGEGEELTAAVFVSFDDLALLDLLAGSRIMRAERDPGGVGALLSYRSCLGARAGSCLGASRSESAKAGMSQLCGAMRHSNSRSIPVLRAHSLSRLRSSMCGQQILAVARDHFGIAVAAFDLVVAHPIPVAGFGEAEQPIEMLLVMGIRC